MKRKNVTSSNAILALEQWVEYLWVNNRKLVYVVVAGILLLVSAKYVVTGPKIGFANGDFDYFLQAYEAIRQSILQYHQFPWWNPWVGGGVPLFANPQVGVISPQTLLVLIFGTAYGLKLSIVLYTCLGFVGAFLLLRRFVGTTVFVSLLLAFIWSHTGFFAAHLIDHYSFVFFLIFPGLAYLQLRLLESRKMWLWFGLAIGLLALSAVHYAFFQIAFLLGVIFCFQAYQAWKRHNLGQLILRALGSGVVFGALAGLRLLLSVQYARDFPRVIDGPPNDFMSLFTGLFTPLHNIQVLNGEFAIGKPYISMEYAADVSIFLGIAVIIGLIGLRMARKISVLGFRALVFLSVAVLFFLISKGDFGGLSPYALLHKLPVFESMQVPSRWLIWAGLALLVSAAYFSLATQRLARTLIIGCLVAATLEMVALSVPARSAQFVRQPSVERSADAEFVQTSFYSPFGQYNEQTAQNAVLLERYLRGESFAYEATLNNIGEIRGYEPMLDTRIEVGDRCSEYISECKFVRSNNARITDWSPNRIVLERTGSGPIELNVAASQYWRVNGARVCPDCRVTNRNNLIINSEDQRLVITVVPKLIRN